MTDSSTQSLFEPRHYPIAVHRGRDVGAGKLRGWGLEFGSLCETRISKDPIFKAAIKAARDRGSLVTQHKLANIYMVIRYAMADCSGDIHEFGSFSGGSAVFMATLLKLLGRPGKVYAYDTYEGMPETDPVRDLHRRGDFKDAGYKELLAYIDRANLGAHIETVKGEFASTLPGVLAQGRKIDLIHVDCDIYEPIKYVVLQCAPSMADGGFLVLDDPLHGSCLGAFDAVQEVLIRDMDLTAEQVYPHLVFRFPKLLVS